MYRTQQTPMGLTPFATGGINPSFGGPGFQGFAGVNGNLAGGGMNPMNGLVQQQAAMSSIINTMMSTMMMMSQMIMLNQMQTMISSMANFGGGTSGSGNGITDFLGGSTGGATGGAPGGPSGGTAPVGGSSAPAATSSDFGSVPAWGAAMAKDAEKHGNGPGGWCFKYVRQALERAGVKGVGGASAYMAADQLAKNPKFREIKVAAKDLPKLPAGAVVVWDRNGSGASSAGKTHGHISISLGDGREVSDVVRKQTTSMGSNVRVFLPK